METGGPERTFPESKSTVVNFVKLCRNRGGLGSRRRDGFGGAREVSNTILHRSGKSTECNPVFGRCLREEVTPRVLMWTRTSIPDG